MNHAPNLRDEFSPVLRFSIMEDVSGIVDGVNILARVKGEFFFPDGTSRNKRFYPAKAWENVIKDPNTQNRLAKRLMFGTIGHDQELNDKAVREGKVSHVMDKIYIENGLGIGEALVMNTPVGAILNTMLRSGSQLSVSSRADGKFRGAQNGIPAIDPDNFYVIGWDFVIDPGFLEANPQIAEALNKETNSGEGEMGGTAKEPMQQLVEHITSENHDLKAKNGEFATENIALKDSNEILAKENGELKEQLATAQTAAGRVKAFEAIGSVDEINQALTLAEKAGKVLKTYEALGTPGDISKAFESTEKHVKSIQEKFGSTREIAAVFTHAQKQNERLEKIGTLPEIEKVFESFGKLMEDQEGIAAETEKQAMAKQAEDLAKELGVPVEDIMELLKTKSADEVKGMYAKVEENLKKKLGINEAAAKPAPASPAYKKKIVESKAQATPARGVEGSSILKKADESYTSSVLGSSRIDRITEKLSK